MPPTTKRWKPGGSPENHNKRWAADCDVINVHFLKNRRKRRKSTGAASMF
jgi:hypothetical protein